MDSLFNYFRDKSDSLSRHIYQERDGLLLCKEYKRFPQISLPMSRLPTLSLGEVLAGRQSTHSFSGGAVPLADVASLLLWSVGLSEDKIPSGKPRRMHPSAGARFSIECYPIFFQESDNVTEGVYHYNACRHVLEKITTAGMFDAQALKQCFAEPFVDSAAVVLVFSFIKQRSFPKYGELAYKLGFLEAGHIGQNVYLAASALGIGCCALGVVEDDALVNMLGFDGVNEIPCYAVALGLKRQKTDYDVDNRGRS